MFTSQPYVADLDGRTRAVVVAPNVGSDFVALVPDGYLWDFLSADARLVTSAAVANRQALFFFDDGANRIWQDQAPVQAASLGVDYLIGEGQQRDVTVAALIKLATFNDVRLFAGWRFGVTTALLDAGDRWFVTMTVREYQSNPATGPRASARRQRFGATRRPGRAY